ncbi:MAG: hypothetical protein CL610_06275 [Anaerolineaceae bacterium]|nr:hypothetical protein [Anaerolineaceae bacterium]
MNDLKNNSVKFVPQLGGTRFFTTPSFSKTGDELQLKAHLLEAEPPKQLDRSKEIMRYAAYVRISSEEQVGNFSIDAQKRAIDQWVKAQGGSLVKIYADEAQSGRTIDRPEFQNMRRDCQEEQI